MRQSGLPLDEPGLTILQTSPSVAAGIREAPRPGDRLFEIAGRRVFTFLDVASGMAELRQAEVPPGGYPRSEEDLYDQGEFWPTVVELDGVVRAEVKFFREGQLRTTWLPLASLPWQDVLLTLVWFLLEFAIFAFSALAFWTRPFDRQARVFFVMCIVTLGGFVGGFHWWVIAGNLWLTMPFVVCAMLAPVVTLHFFLVYPEPKSPLLRHPRLTLAALYAVPAVSVVWLCGLLWYAWGQLEQGAAAGRVAELLDWLNDGVYGYLLIAACYFLATVVALAISFFATRNATLQSQVKWILWAAVVATIPVGYSMYLAHFRQAQFALGAASLPMFAASLLFMVAYAVGIVRYKLMLFDQILSRRMMYYILSLAVTVLFSLAIALSSLAGAYRGQWAPQTPLIIGFVVVAVLLLNWTRDRLQEQIDRRFFREKYQLDKALQRMNQSTGGLADPQALGQRMLSSCRDLLAVDHAALYLWDSESASFRLVAAEGVDRAPRSLARDDELLGLLDADPNLHRGDDAAEADSTPAQLLLRRLDVELVHGLDHDGQLAGILMLGAKRGGGRYTAEDLALLASLSQITSVALSGARVHQAATRLNAELQLKLETIAEQQRLIAMLQAEITSRAQVEAPGQSEPLRRHLIKGTSPAMRDVLETVRKVSGSQSSVLVRGESGTGKELLAQALHDNSPRRGGPMVSVHCGALSPGLLESELFGHVKGSFTGAHRDKIGRFEMADGGTLFLDEIGDISLETQIKLLRVLQQREFEPVGGTRPIRVDVRLVAATHQNLERLIAEGRFREDLFYRLNVISITLPPLRERGDDIVELALHFLTRAAERAGKPVTHFDDQALLALRRYAWPGNIRELENAIERAVVMVEGTFIGLADLPAAVVEALGPSSRVLELKPAAALPARIESFAPPPVAVPATGPPDRQARRAAERERLVEALVRAHGNKADAARMLGMPRSTFFSKLRSYRIE